MKFLTVLFTYFLFSLNVSIAMENFSDKETITHAQYAQTPRNSHKGSRHKKNPKPSVQMNVDGERTISPRTQEKENPENTQKSLLKKEQQAEEVSFFQNTLEGFLEEIKVQNQKGHDRQEPNWTLIFLAYKDFNKLDFSECFWETYSRKVKAYLWPSQQSWKDVVGGYLFFPPETLEWESMPYESYHLRRIDYLWAFAIGAKFNHSLAKFYLAKMLDTTRDESIDPERPEFFHKLFREAYNELSQCCNNPDACFVIGCNYIEKPYLSVTYFPQEKKNKGLGSAEEALLWHTNGNDLRNQFRILHIEKSARTMFDPPTADAYLDLARKGYKPAYSKAAALTKGYKKRKKIHNEAIDNGYTIARLALGVMFRDIGMLNEARKCYTEAGEGGTTYGYIKLGLSYVGNVQSEQAMQDNPLKGYKDTEIEETKKAFQLAGEWGNPEGWEYLARLYCQLNKEKSIPL